MQQLQQQAPPSFARPAPTTFDEASMERSRGFVKALQVRPPRPGSGRSRLYLTSVHLRLARRAERSAFCAFIVWPARV
jgi:hypothetical protein